MTSGVCLIHTKQILDSAGVCPLCESQRITTVLCRTHNRPHPKYANCPDCERETMRGGPTPGPVLGFFSMTDGRIAAHNWLSDHHAKGYVFNQMTVWRDTLVIAVSHKGN